MRSRSVDAIATVNTSWIHHSQVLELLNLCLPWLDIFHHCVLAVMLALSVGSLGLQTTQDQYQLICISSVKCSNVAENNTASVSGNG